MTILNQSFIPISSAPACEEIAGMVSTVITSYNKGPYLAEAIDSALAQDYPHREILVIDDGSTDHTPEVAGAYEDRIRYIRQENRGPSGAKNRGIIEVRGEFIAFLDGDDRWRPGKLTKQIECLPPQSRGGPGLQRLPPVPGRRDPQPVVPRGRE